LEIGPLFWDDRPFHGANLETNATVDTGGKVNPIPVGALTIFAGSFVDTGHRTSINAVGNALAGVGYDCVGHGYKSSENPGITVLHDIAIAPPP